MKEVSLGSLLLLCSISWGASELGSISESVSSRFQVNASDHLIFSSAKNDVDQTAPPTQTLMNEGKLHSEYGYWNGDIHFTNRYEPDPNKRSSPTFNLEKKSLRFESKDWQFILGDSHPQLGEA